MKMKKIVKRVRGTFAIVLSLAMAVGIFAGTGMNVQAEGEFVASPYTLLSEDDYWALFQQCDVFTADEKDRIANYLATSHINGALYFVSVGSPEAGGVIFAWSNNVGWLKNGSNIVEYNEIESAGYTSYYIIKRSGTAGTPAAPTGGKSEASHSHSYSWVTVQEATVGQDGMEEYRCSCGDVQGRNVIPASEAAVKGLYGEIKNTPQGGTASFDSGRLYTFSDYIIKKLAERSDVTMVITFEYQNRTYKMTIPAGADYTSLLADHDYFYGYFYFANAVGATIEAL